MDPDTPSVAALAALCRQLAREALAAGAVDAALAFLRRAFELEDAAAAPRDPAQP